MAKRETRYRSLDADKIIATLDKLEQRIGERFPSSGLSRVCAELIAVAKQTSERIASVSRPNWTLRTLLVCLVGGAFAILFYLISQATTFKGTDEWSEALQGLDALFNIAVLLGIIFGGIIATVAGKMSFASVAAAPWLDFVYPFQFGTPTFEIWSIVTMCIVMIVVMVESTGMFLALGEMTGKKIDSEDLTKGLRADGVGTLLGGIFNTFPYTSFSQNVGLVGVTGVRSRWVALLPS